MDHAVSGDPNLSPKDKKAAVEGFVRSFLHGDTQGYLQQLREFGERSDFTWPNKTYILSREWLKKGTNSLKAYTNVDLLIETIERRTVL